MKPSTPTNKPWCSVACRFIDAVLVLFMQSLDQKDSKLASLGFAILYKFGKNLKLPGDCEGLPALIAQGLLKKISIHVMHTGTKCISLL